MDQGTRGELLGRLAGVIESVTTSHPLRVAIDGPPAAGKTTLADELALLLRSRGRDVVRATTEGFQLPRAQRYRRGEFSPDANYHDSFDYDALRRVLLDPLGPGGDRRYQHAVYDLGTDSALSPPVTTAAADAVLLLDGVFLLRPELIDRWDLSIFVSVAFEQTLDRARIRDLALLGSAAEVERRFRTRYIPAQQLYFATARPAEHADIIVHNDEPTQPAWEVRRPQCLSDDRSCLHEGLGLRQSDRPAVEVPLSEAAAELREQSGDTLPGMVSGEQQRFLPLRGLASILAVLLAVVVAIIAARLAIQMLSPGTAQWRRSLIVSRLDQAADITIFALSILFVVWFRRARINAERYDYPQRRARGWAFWGWIVPIVNIWFPFQIMGDIWRAGLPARQRRKTAWLPALWWTSWLISGLSFGAQGKSEAVPHMAASTPAFVLCSLATAGATLIAIIRIVSDGPVGQV